MSLSGGSAVTGYYITIYDKNGADQCAYYEVDGATVSSVELDNEVLGETVFAGDIHLYNYEFISQFFERLLRLHWN